MGFSSAANWCVRVFGLDSPRSRAWKKDLKTVYLEDDSRSPVRRKTGSILWATGRQSCWGPQRNCEEHAWASLSEWQALRLLSTDSHAPWFCGPHWRKGVTFSKLLLLVTLEEDSMQKKYRVGTVHPAMVKSRNWQGGATPRDRDSRHTNKF